jgi:hypothetical protein
MKKFLQMCYIVLTLFSTFCDVIKLRLNRDGPARQAGISAKGSLYEAQKAVIVLLKSGRPYGPSKINIKKDVYTVAR